MEEWQNVRTDDTDRASKIQSGLTRHWSMQLRILYLPAPSAWWRRSYSGLLYGDLSFEPVKLMRLVICRVPPEYVLPSSRGHKKLAE